MKRWLLLCIMIGLVVISGQTVLAQQPCAPCPDGAQCLVPECPEETPEAPVPDVPQIRIWNRSEFDMEQVSLQILSQTESFGLIASGQTSGYVGFETAYHYGKLDVLVNGEQLSMIPIDYVGETPLEPGYYTYALDVQDGALSLEFLTPIVTVHYTGGMCVNGGCDRLVTLYDNGSLVIVDGAGEESVQTVSEVNQPIVDDLIAEIEATDFEQIRSRPFTGTCPIAYDGQELTFSFYRVEGIERFSTCEVEFDESVPLYQAVIAVVDKPVA